MTNWPKADQYVAVSCIMSPVTQTAEVEVNNASEKGVASPLRLENGHALLYLYRPAELRRDLQNGLAREILSSAGYRCGSCEGCVYEV